MSNTLEARAASGVGVKPVLGLVSTWVFALLPANLVPAIIGRLVVDHGVDVTTASAVATGMTLANAVAILLLRPLAARGHRKLIARTGALFLVVPLLIALFTLDPNAVMIALVIGGLGSGMAIAASTAAVSATSNPDSATNIVMIVNRFVVSLSFFLIPFVGGGLQSVLWIIIIPGMIALLGAAWLPSAPADETSAVEAIPRTQTIELFDSLERPMVRGLSWALAIGFAIWSVTDDGVFGLVEIFAAENIPGMDPSVTTMLLGVAILCGLGGALVAMPLSRLLGRSTALVALLTLSLIAKVGLMIGSTQAIFTISNCAWGFAFGAMLPIIFGLAAQMTRNGSSSVLVNGVYILGVALGPLVSSQIFSATNSTVLCVVMTALAALGAIPIVYVAKISQKKSQKVA